MKIEEAIQQKVFKDVYNKAIVNILYTQSFIVSKQSSLFKPFGLSPEQYNVLRILKGQNNNPITVSSIQERMLNKMSNASRLVEKLKQKGYVVREECPTDRRQVDIRITEEGLNVLKELENQIYEMNRKLIQLDEQEVEILNNLLDKSRG
ncbi:transcriptional regulator, MarR family [Indibacter alkaliphilus LW1]|jgi:DNA-binding MarR family transcriptional regulator|uniref:Transcriptional regulator, MarR family n=1 Tax=Indibacter alkaliphilus (strain CCUG 57479 / KCTC 22604 / LW1) TaxID=1189612 RepID=S2EBK3_INDAL|nr:MarR family transcriptional regulator [Indibacter alkaliphilus]EOZ99758.1 transcriptional regulator, MarR family [Indibacter alkaliphilus LW1]